MKKWLVVIPMILLSGCATTANLQYKVDSPKKEAKQISVNLNEFSDARSIGNKGVIGRILNMYGADFGPVNEPSTLLHDLKAAMSHELTNAGYTISNSEQKAISIQCSLKELMCDFTASQQGESNIQIGILVAEQGQEVLNHVYEAEGKCKPLLGYGTNEAITKATKKVISDFIKDLDNYAKS